MAGVKINDINLLRFCYSKVIDKDINDLKDTFPTDRCVGFGEYGVDGDYLWAVTIYDFQANHDCVLDIAMNIKGLFSRELFSKMARVIFDYLFNQAKLIRCTINVRESNKRSLRLVKAWGFKEEGYKRLGYGPPKPEGMIILGIVKEECKWI